MKRFEELMSDYKSVVELNGKTYKDRALHDLKEARRNFLQNSPTGQIVKINGIEHLVQITDRAFANNDLIYKHLVGEPGLNLKPGDYIVWDGEPWMVYVTEEEVLKSKHGCSLLPVKDTLTWQDEYGNIYKTPCYMDDSTSTYSSGITHAGGIVTSRSDQVLAIVQENEFTKKIPYNMRFVFRNDPQLTYRTFRKKFRQHGILEFVMRADTFNVEKDRADLSLADYHEPTNLIQENGISGNNIMVRYTSQVYRLPKGYKAQRWNVLPKKKGVYQLEMSEVKADSITLTAKITKQLGEHTLIAYTVDDNDNEKEFTFDVKVVAS